MKTLLIATGLLISSMYSFAQNCKYEVNEMDKFTGQLTKETKHIDLSNGGDVDSDLGFRKVGEDYFLIVDFQFDNLSQTQYSINAGAQLLILLSDGTKLDLVADQTIAGSNVAIPAGTLTLHLCTIKDVGFTISKELIQKLSTQNITDIRVKIVKDDGSERDMSSQVKAKNAEKVKAQVMCVL